MPSIAHTFSKAFLCEFYLNIVPLDLLSVLGKQFRRHDLALLILSLFVRIFGFRNLFCARIRYVILCDHVFVFRIDRSYTSLGPLLFVSHFVTFAPTGFSSLG